MASIKGLQKTSLVDFPPYLACTVFISTCNFRCGFCYNVDLVNDSDKLQEYSEGDIFKFLDKRKNVLDGVCITGGEPTLYGGLKEFISKVKSKGFKVKLDTNGANPKVLKLLIDEKLLDYIAMDIKSSKEKYSKAAGARVDIGKIQESIDLIRNSGVDYEFRTTVVPDFFSEDDAKSIGEWLKGSKKYALQQVVIRENMIDPDLRRIRPYDISELEKLKKILASYFEEVEVRA